MIVSFIVATLLTSVSYGVGLYGGYIDKLNWLEIFSVWTSYSCTYLCVVQSRLNYVIGAISVAALGVLFWQQSLFGSMALQVYLFPIMLYGWWRWGPDDNTRPVSWLHWDWWTAGYFGITAAALVVTVMTSKYFDGNFVWLDSAIFVLSILGQFLLDNKKWENWIVWIGVDVISVYEYWQQGLIVVAIQMGLFILNALWGMYEWQKKS